MRSEKYPGHVFLLHPGEYIVRAGTPMAWGLMKSIVCCCNDGVAPGHLVASQAHPRYLPLCHVASQLI